MGKRNKPYSEDRDNRLYISDVNVGSVREQLVGQTFCRGEIELNILCVHFLPLEKWGGSSDNGVLSESLIVRHGVKLNEKW